MKLEHFYCGPFYVTLKDGIYLQQIIIGKDARDINDYGD